MSERGNSSIPSPGFSGSLSGGGSDVGGQVCYTNSNSSFTGCVSGSTSNGGTGGISLTFRW